MKGKASNAFSLVEIIVTTSVVAMLLLLAIPVASQLRQWGQNTRCVSNLKQLGVALLAHANDHNGHIPPRIQANPERPGTFLAETFWHKVLYNLGYLTPVDAPKRQRIHYCPSTPYLGSNNESYGMRRWRSPGEPMDTSQNLRTLREPAGFFLLVDSWAQETKGQGYFVAGGSGWRIRLGHSGRANALFADGHVAAKGRDYFDATVSSQSDYTTNRQDYFYEPE